MKKLLFGFFILWIDVGCKPSSERDDAKYLGTWKGYPRYDSYFSAVVTLNGRNDFPYNIVILNYDASTKRTSEFGKSPFKISGDRLIGETMVDGTLPTFSFNESKKTFLYFGFERFSGLNKNHTK